MASIALVTIMVASHNLKLNITPNETMTGHTAESHKLTRKAMKDNDDKYHHPVEKIAQLKEFQYLFQDGKILEVFGGAGNLTKYYQKVGEVTSMTKETTGDSFHSIYALRAERKKYKLIDIDSYGYPDKFFPLVFEMLEDEGYIVFTFPILGVNALNGIVEQHFINFWHSDRPSIGDIIGVLTDQALREWKLLSLIDARKIKRIWRILVKAKRVKATEMTNVKNRQESML